MDNITHPTHIRRTTKQNFDIKVCTGTDELGWMSHLGNTFKTALAGGFLIRNLQVADARRNFTEALTLHMQQYYAENRGASTPNSIKKNPQKPWKPIDVRHSYEMIFKQAVTAEVANPPENK